MWRIRLSLLLACALCACPAPARAGFLAHGSVLDSISGNDYFAFEADSALIGGLRTYGFGAAYPPSVSKRIFNEKNDRFRGFGADGNQTLTVDESLHGDVTRVLGPATRLNLGGYEERMLCYVSAKPGDDTAVLFTLSKCPEDCSRVSEIQVRARKKDVRALRYCARAPGVSRDIATESGLRLGLTAEQVKAVLGAPQHVQKGLQGAMWFYAASASVRFSAAEAARRGYPQMACPPGKDYPGSTGFDKYIVVWFRHGRLSAWRVWLDWGL